MQGADQRIQILRQTGCFFNYKQPHPVAPDENDIILGLLGVGDPLPGQGVLLKFAPYLQRLLLQSEGKVLV